MQLIQKLFCRAFQKSYGFFIYLFLYPLKNLKLNKGGGDKKIHQKKTRIIENEQLLLTTVQLCCPVRPGGDPGATRGQPPDKPPEYIVPWSSIGCPRRAPGSDSQEGLSLHPRVRPRVRPPGHCPCVAPGAPLGLPQVAPPGWNVCVDPGCPGGAPGPYQTVPLI